MTLRERLKELQGKGVKIGGIKGASFIYIGKVDENTDKVIDILGHTQFQRMLGRLKYTKIKLEKFPEEEKLKMEQLEKFYEELRTERLNDHLSNLKALHKKATKTNKQNVEKSCKALQMIQPQYEKAKETCIKMLVKRKGILEDTVATLSEFSENNSATSDLEVVEDHRSIDYDTFGYRILLIDMYLNGTIWSLAECERSTEIKRAIRSIEEKTAMVID